MATPSRSTEALAWVRADRPTPSWAGTEGLAPVPGAEFAELDVDLIRPNPKQPRSVFDEDQLELVHSIREIGVLQPVVVRRIPAEQLAEAQGKRYELIMGERRLRATQEADLATIPAIIKETHDDDLLRDALLENLHRSQLNPLEEAAAYQQLLDDFGCSHEELAGRIGRSRPQISNTLRLLKLPPLVQRRLAAGVLSAGHARALLGSRTVQRWSGWPSASSPKASRFARWRSWSPSVTATWLPGPRRPRAGGSIGSRWPHLGTVGSPGEEGQHRVGAAQGKDHRGVRVDGGPQAHPRDHGPRPAPRLTASDGI